MATLQRAEAEVRVAKAAVESSAVRLGYARITSPISGRIGKASVTPGALVTANEAQPLATVQQFDPIYVDRAQAASQLLELLDELPEGRVATVDHVPVTILLGNGREYAHRGTEKCA